MGYPRASFRSAFLCPQEVSTSRIWTASSARGGGHGKLEPYAWVGATSDKKLANMQLEIHRDIHNNLLYPYYTNTKHIQKFAELRSYKAAAPKVATKAESVAKAETLAAKADAKRKAVPQESGEKHRRGDKHIGDVD